MQGIHSSVVTIVEKAKLININSFLIDLYKNSPDITNLWITPEPARATQNHPELARATQESARAPARANQSQERANENLI